MDLLKDFDGNIDQTGTKLLYEIFGGIGDLLWRTTLFRELKRRNPKMKLIISGRYYNSGTSEETWKLIYKNNPYIDELRPNIQNIGLKTDDVDEYVTDQLCMHTRTDYGKKIHAIDALGVWAGFEIYDKSYWYQTTKEEKKWAKLFLDKYKPGKIVGIGLGASTWIRTWNQLEVKRLIKYLIYNKYKVVILDSKKTDLKDENIINMAGGYTIREVSAIIEQLDLLITPDTGYLHFGGHFNTPTIAVFGATSPELRSKYYDNVIPIVGRTKLTCWPCYMHAVNCKYGTPPPCINQITLEQIIEEGESYLQ